MSIPKYRVRALNREEFAKVDLVDDEAELIRAHFDALAKLGDSYMGDDGGFCAVVYRGDEPLFIGGYKLIDSNVFQVFVMPDKRVYQFPKAFYESTKQFLFWLMRHEWCERIQTFSLPTCRIDRWMKALGFVCEGDADVYTEAGKPYRLWSLERANGVWRTN